MDNTSPSLLGYLQDRVPVAAHRPWPRFDLDPSAWTALIEELSNQRDWSLLALWGEPTQVHMALRDDVVGDIAVMSVPAGEDFYPSVAWARPGAMRMQRAIHDLYGFHADAWEDKRPWIDHGRWPNGRPLALLQRQNAGYDAPYEFLTSEGEGLHQIPVGPVHAGVIEPGHFRFTCNGETVVRLEQRLGYVHKGIEKLFEGRSPLEGAKLASRISGDSAIAHSLAYAHAIEAALNVEPPPRAVWLRALMAELERLANHLGDIGAICNDVAFALAFADCMVLRERVLRANHICFGHRLMMDRIIPGGVAVDISCHGRDMLFGLLTEVRPRFEEVVAIYDNKPSLLDRTVGTGIAHAHLVHQYGAGGVVGRASSRGHDARKSPGYAPYEELDFDVPVRNEGDVNARVWVRIEEARASMNLIEQIADALPKGPLTVPLPRAAGEGMALVEGFRGEIMTWVRLGENGNVARCYPRDPSWFQWPLLEACIEGNIVADFPVCNKSFNCSYSGHDL